MVETDIQSALVPDRFPQLARLSMMELDGLRFASRLVVMRKGEALTREGEIGRLRADAIVGETSLLDGLPANATLRVVSEQARVIIAPGSLVTNLLYTNAGWCDALIELSNRYLMLRALRANRVLRRLPREAEFGYLAEAMLVTALRGELLSGRTACWPTHGWLIARGRMAASHGDRQEPLGAGALIVPGEAHMEVRAVSDARIVRIPPSLLDTWKERLGLRAWPPITPGLETEH